MNEILFEKIDHIERMIIELNIKIDNFLGYEDLTEEDGREISEIYKEIRDGEYVRFDELFGI